MQFSATKTALIMTVGSIIALNAFGVPVEEPLKTISLMIVSFYFGQKANAQ